MSQTGDRRGERVPSAELAAFVSDLSFDDVPADAVRLVERCFVDTVGVTLAGARADAGTVTADAFGGDSGEGKAATLVGTDRRAALTDAAFVNGTAGHALDYDDVSGGGIGHQSVALIPPLLGLAETRVDGTTGADLIAAYAAGFETGHYLGAAIGTSHYAAGWHSTATFGTFGAAAAAAHLLGLDEDRTRNALTVAASMPAGLKRNFGTTTKPIHAGNAARAGLTAALAAAEGATGDPDAIGGEGGFFELYGGDGTPDLDALPALGERWALVEDGVHVKKYPCCYFAQPSMAAARALVETHDIDPADVDRIHVVTNGKSRRVLRYEDPGTGLEAKFSMPYAVASVVVRDRVGLDAFEDDAVDDPDVDAVRERVTFEADPDLPAESRRATVTVETTGGAAFERVQDLPPGAHDNPLTDEELRAKFLDCATRALDGDDARAAYRAFDSLRERDAAATLVGHLRP
jgi:2-methylcitrate dehydratase PrpD